jgi:hypothetical protein
MNTSGFDIHSLSKLELNVINKYEPYIAPDYKIDRLLGVDKDEVKAIFKPSSKYRKVYIMLDSRYAASNDGYNISWNFQNNENVADGSVNAVGVIRDIVSIRLLDFYMHLYTAISTGIVGNYGAITVHIKEFDAQSFITQTGTKFHFWGKLWYNANNNPSATYQRLISFSDGSDEDGINENYYRLQDGNQGEFKFATPLTELNTLTLNFGNPMNPIPLDQASFPFSYIPGTTILGTPVNIHIDTTLLLTDLNTYLAPIYISGFNTSDPVADAELINFLNNPPCVLIYNLQPVSPYGMIIAGGIASSGSGTFINSIYPWIPRMTIPNMVGVQTGGTVFIDMYRLYVPMEITYIESECDK